ncbi:MAG: hypothetical protein WCD57_23525 [Acidobacteriaceae bacterium]
MSVVGAKWALLGGLVVTAGLGIAAAQFNGSNPAANGQLEQLGRAHSSDEPSYATRELQERQLKRLREEHQKEILGDTDRLLQLATALKAEVEKRDKAATPDVVKDVDEIGKLAKRVSERIKTQ